MCLHLSKPNQYSKTGKVPSTADLIKLSVADPGFDTPNYIKEAMTEALKGGFTHYSGTRGLEELRKALSEFYSKNYSLEVNPDSEILPTNGAGEALFIILYALSRNGGEVIIPDPSYHGFIHKLPVVGLTPVYAHLRKDNGFELDVDSIRDAINEKTRAIFLCNPNNPTGVVYSKKELESLAQVIKENKHVKLISDECYSRILYDGAIFYSLMRDQSIRENVLVVNSFSKTYAMTGWRLGWVLGSKPLIDEYAEIAFNMRSSVNTAVQVAGANALKGDNSAVKSLVEKYNENRQTMMSELRSMGIPFTTPKGGFEIFADFSRYERDSVKLKKRMEDEIRVQTVAGSEFGPNGEGYLRLVFCVKKERMVEGLQRIRLFLENYES